MTFSLIMATIGRQTEVRRFLESLAAQPHRDFELIVADQNESNEVELLCQEYSSTMDIKCLHLDRAGLSFARNAGLRVAQGDVVAFPDDDCEYPPSLLDDVREWLDGHPEADLLAGTTRDRATARITVARYDAEAGPINCNNVWRRQTSCSIFVRRQVFDSVGLFDERLGLPDGAAEDADIVLRAVEAGYRTWYFPDIIVYHPRPLGQLGPSALARAYRYGFGIGAVFGKHIVARRNFRMIPQLLAHLLRPLGGCLLYSLVDPTRSRYYLRCLAGRISGFVRYRASPRRLEGS